MAFHRRADMQVTRKSHSRQKGSALIEFVLCFALFWVPLFLGTLVIGFNVIRAIQVTQVCRDAGHMYSYGMDFSQSAYQNLLVSLAPGLNMTVSGGKGVVILSTVTYVDQTDCTAGGYPHCANLNQTVFTRRIVIGNSGLYSSAFGTPLEPNGQQRQYQRRRLPERYEHSRVELLELDSAQLRPIFLYVGDVCPILGLQLVEHSRHNRSGRQIHLLIAGSSTR